MTRIFHWFFMWKMDPMSGFVIRLFTLPHRDSTMQYKRCVHLWNNFPCIITLDQIKFSMVLLWIGHCHLAYWVIWNHTNSPFHILYILDFVHWYSSLALGILQENLFFLINGKKSSKLFNLPSSFSSDKRRQKKLSYFLWWFNLIFQFFFISFNFFVNINLSIFLYRWNHLILVCWLKDF